MSSLFARFEFLRTIRTYWWLIALPTAAFFGLSVAYAVLGPKQWRASQVFHLRDEMIGQNYRPGHFSSLDDMKTAQETILEIARNPTVLRPTLTHLEGGVPPSAADIEDAQGAVQISSSNGEELGKTELIRLSVVDKTPERAKLFCQTLTDNMEAELRNVRFNRASSMVAELERAVDAAKGTLSETARQIEVFELNLGPDLTDLRNLIEPTSGDNLLYRNLNQIEAELRAAQLTLDSVVTQRRLLREALDDVNAIVATPNELLNWQPALRRLKDGLVDAQLKLATLRGDYRDNHPKVAAAIDAVESIERELLRELDLSVRGLSDQIEIYETNLARLTGLRNDATDRLRRLSEQRVIYDQLNEEYKRRDQTLRDAQAAVSQAESIRQAAEHVDLLTRVNNVQVASRPEGPSKKTVVGATTILGFFMGLGLVMLWSGGSPRLATPSDGGELYAMEASPLASQPVTRPSPGQPSPQPRETVDQILERGSFAVTVMPASFLLSKPHADERGPAQ
jgi:uncharacterized protein involved in exopolysaccharide biosynthesis